MEVKQIYELTNDVVKETLGSKNEQGEIVTPVTLTENLSNLVDVGDAVFNASAHENYLHTLVDHIGRMMFVVRKYTGSAPSILMDEWEFGSVLEKVRGEMPEATENESWELEDGASYDENIFTAPKVSAKFYNKRVTFEVPISVTDDQMKSAFDNATQMSKFLDMIYNKVDQALQVRTNQLIKRTINNAIATVVHHEIPDEDYGEKSTNCAVNLLKLYNDEHAGETGFVTLTAEKCLKDKAFLRFVALMLKLYSDRMVEMSKQFNINGTEKFSGKEYQRLVMLADLRAGTDIYLQSDTFHNEFTKLPSADTVPFWQGSGATFDFETISTINVKTAYGDDVKISGVLACLFDRDACVVCNYKRKVTSKYNARAEFTNLWYKQFAGYINDFDENFVVFFVADAE